MALPFYLWSKTAASNATADPTVNWAEGQSPSSVNDSARAMMASTAAYRDDTSGILLTAGTSTAYTLTTNEVFDTLAHMDGKELSFTVHTTNGASATLNVDGLGAVPLIIDTSSGTTPVPAATMITGAVHTAVYYNSGSTFRLKGFYPIVSASIPSSAVTYAKIQNVTAARLLGNPTGGAAAPSEISLGTGLAFSGTALNSSAIPPTTQVFTSGTSQTYTTPAGVKWLEVTVIGGGSGGGGGNNNSASTAGNASAFGSFNAGGGSGSSQIAPGAGGTASGGYWNMAGQPGGAPFASSSASNGAGGTGGSLVGGGGAGSTSTGGSATANSGAGGGGGGSSNGTIAGSGGFGGSSGGMVKGIISSPSATYTYTVGTGGAGAAGVDIASSDGVAGGGGAAGIIVVVEHY